MFRLLDDPLCKQVRDLRSAVVKEACATLGVMAVALRDGFRPLGYMLLPTLIDVTASGNKVICGHVHEAVKVVLAHSHVKNAVPIILDVIRSKWGPCVCGDHEYSMHTVLILTDTNIIGVQFRDFGHGYIVLGEPCLSLVRYRSQ